MMLVLDYRTNVSNLQLSEHGKQTFLYITSNNRVYIYIYIYIYVCVCVCVCVCNGRNETVDHLIYDCTILRREREKLISKVSKQDKWPVTKIDLVNKFIKHFLEFTNTIDFKKL